ncbi:MAG TPA: PAS domain S-box protein [Steroidobacteraceae bacterium]
MSVLGSIFHPAGLAGLIAGLLLAGLPGLLYFVVSRRTQQRLRKGHGELAVSNRRNRAIVEASGEGVLELNSSGLVRYANPAAARLLGYEPEELPGLDYKVLINTGDEGDAPSEVVRKVRYTTDIMRGVGALLRRKDGQRRPVEYRIVPVTELGASVGTVLTFRDVTDRVRLDSLLRDMQTTAQVGGWEYDVATQKIHWTDAVYAIHDLPAGQRIDLDLVRSFFSKEDQEKFLAVATTTMESGKTADLQIQLTGARGRKIWVRVIFKSERRAGKTIRLHGTVQDITDRVIAEQQVLQTRDFYELTLDAMPTLVTYTDRDLTITYANKAVQDWLGAPREECVGMNLRALSTPESWSAVADHVAAALRGELGSATYTASRNGRARDWQAHFVPEVAANGEVRGFFSIVYDLTELKRLEARLLQAQKMEAIGQLTGGIAHDFNNLLGVVLGNLQLLERNLLDQPAMARKVHTAMRAAVRGADLTRRLLAFARRQILAPAVLDLNRQLAGITDLMQRTLGESVEVRMVQSPQLWHTRVDSGQFENAILNLAINARDAMLHGGRLTVRTQNVGLDAQFCSDHPQVEPGEYVSVSVTDTGSGIEPEVLTRVFEPFFTTKESGKGSGLGLAMVHGFAEQAGGIATIESKVGRGTTVTILLPRCREQQSLREDTIVTKFSPGGSESILVVEDDADLRETVVTALTQLGYRALPAPNAETALRILAGPEPIDLLFTDVMMPGGMLGPALANRARELRPDIEVLFTTGYAENSVLSSVAGITASDVIYKPYRNEELAMRVRYVLDREARVA